MKILIIGRYKEEFPQHLLPFVVEQADAVRVLGHTIDYFPIQGSGSLAYFKASKLLKNKISLFKPDIIHAHYGLSGITAVLQNRIPVVTTFHNGEVSSIGVNIISSLFSLRAQHVIYVAQHIYDKCYFKSKTGYSILPCGISIDDCVITDQQKARQELGFHADKKYILFGGGFDNLRKNYPLLQQAIDVLGRTDIEVLEMKGLDRSTITKLMCACDLFALPSKSEGSPQALKEAMACNCPILATDVADIKHLLGDLDGHYVCTFEVQNVAEQLAAALTFNKRTQGRQRIMELGLSNELVAKKLIEIYVQISDSNR